MIARSQNINEQQSKLNS
uniref:Uncharacterized protein n=1 Tax=Anguilla anguilla TaxID=7936 RepID=A0A0E9UX13_ANGAN